MFFIDYLFGFLNSLFIQIFTEIVASCLIFWFVHHYREKIRENLTLPMCLILIMGITITLFYSYKFYAEKQEREKEEDYREAQEKERLEIEKKHLLAEIKLNENLRLAENGDVKAMYDIGLYYVEYEHNYNQAVYWYIKSAEKGFITAMHELGRYYQNQGHNKDKAIYWYTKAANKGSVKSMYLLASHYGGRAFGGLVKRDYNKAVYWYTKAAEKGHIASQYELYYMYANGVGVKKNYRTAYKWLSLLRRSATRRFTPRPNLEVDIEQELRNLQLKFRFK